MVDDVSDLLDLDAFKYIPSHVKLDKRLSEKKYRSEVRIFYRGLDDIITCNKSYILYNGDFFGFECRNGDQEYYYPYVYGEYINKNNKRMSRIAEMDFLVINDMAVDIHEHKTGVGYYFYDKVSAQLIRNLILASYVIDDRPIVGYAYLGKKGDLYRTAALVKEDDEYILIWFNYAPRESSKIIRLDKKFMEKIVSSNRKTGRNIIMKYIIEKIGKNNDKKGHKNNKRKH